MFYKKKFKGRQNKRNRARPKPNKTNKTNNTDKAQKTYLHLFEKYLHVRRKYFESFHTKNSQQVAKLEKNFYGHLEELRNYERSHKDKIKNLKMDYAYSKNHNIDHTVKETSSDEPAEPHYLIQQKEADYSKDREESVGTLEDYLRYKGLPPVKS